MTRQILITHLKEIKGFKVVCRKCGAYFLARHDEGSLPSDECLYCGPKERQEKPEMERKIPSADISMTLKLLKHIAFRSSQNDFDVFIETEG